jgi:hypothetical protein
MLRSSRNLNARLREVQRSERALMLGSWLSLVLAPFGSNGQTHAMKSFDFEWVEVGCDFFFLELVVLGGRYLVIVRCLDDVPDFFGGVAELAAGHTCT